MDITSVKTTVTEFMKKYKFVFIVLLIGIALMLLPGTKETSNQNTNVSVSEKITQNTNIDEELEELLSKISGAGKVEVMLTISKGEQTVFQTDEDHSWSEDSEQFSIDTVIVTDSSRNENGLVTRVDPAEYLGAVVLCQGADSPSVKLAIIDAVSKITGLSSDRICVLKMK